MSVGGHFVDLVVERCSLYAVNAEIVLLCVQKSMSTYVSDCYDSIAIFLCIHIILRFRAITTKRDIPALNKSVSQ